MNNYALQREFDLIEIRLAMWTCYEELKRMRELAQKTKPESSYIDRSLAMETDLIQAMVKLNRVDLDARAQTRRCFDLERINLELQAEVQSNRKTITNLIDNQ